MGWTRVANSTSTNTASAAALSWPYPGAVTTGNLLLAVAFAKAGTTTSVTVTDNAGNTWTQAVTSIKNSTDSSFMTIWYAVAGGSATPTVTITPNTGLPGMALALHEFNPGSPPTSFTIALDGTNSAVFTSNTTTPSCGSIPVAGSGELVLAAAGEGSLAWSGTYTAGTGFTMDQAVSTSPTAGTEYDLSANSAIAGAFTTSQTRPWSCAGASFSATAASVSALIRNLVSRSRVSPAYFE